MQGAHGLLWCSPLPTVPWRRPIPTEPPTGPRRPGAGPLDSRDHRRALGAEGEARAAEHLASAGYRILARNVRSGGVELDLVAARGRLRVFVEVKTRRSRRFGRPEEAVDARKRERLVRAAAAWMREHPLRGGRVRFDVIAVEPGPDGRWSVRHLPAAFDADWW